MAQGGFTPYQALRAATLHGAMYLGLSGALGRVQPGYLADLAIIRGDVLQDLRLSERVTWVIRGGLVYQASDLARVAPTPAPALKLPLGGRDAQADQQTHAQGLCGCNSLH